MSLEKPSLDELFHYGIKRRSGRYPWGSGDEPYQHEANYLNRVNELRKSGLSDTEIAKHFGQSTTDFRNEYKYAMHEHKRLRYEKAKSLRDKGYSTYKIGEELGLPESTVRSILDPHTQAKLEKARETYNFLKKQVDEKKYIDVGKGVEKELGITRAKMDEALYMLRMEGYEIRERYIDQATMPGQKTTYKVLCPPDTDFNEFKDIVDEIKPVTDYKSHDGGETFQPKFVYPKSMDSNRLAIRYKEDGGIEKDGIIELRRGVDDLSLGNARYAQVRILVDGTHYMKGVAVYSDDMPDGVDVVFNTNKSNSVAKMDVLKKIKDNPDNPFGSNIKPIDEGGQHYYTDKDGKQQLSLINKKSDMGDWEDWSNNLPSQFLSKQPIQLAKKQLGLAADRRTQEFNDICALTNPTVKKKLLESFADDCDSAAVNLKAAALPRQQYHVIIPINTLKDNEIYAPNYDDGEQVALIRYPHGGTFEIPICTVNNKNATGKKLLGKDVVDAVGINSKVAERLSGADFDGDTVMVIPMKSAKIKSTPPLKGLEGFDPKMEYSTIEKNGKYYNQYGEEVKIMRDTGNQMGRVSNLITDMTLQGADQDEIARAVRHSMVVIDAEKHKLDYKRSEVENDIKSLKAKYQGSIDPETGRYREGASTLISRSKGEVSVDKTQGSYKINSKLDSKGKPNPDYDPSKPEGAKIFKPADDLYYPAFVKDSKHPGMRGYRLADGRKKVWYDPEDKKAHEYYKPVKVTDPDTGEVYFTNKTGELRYYTNTRKKESTRMAETDDAFTLVSTANTPMERLYADYANKMKALANQARKELITTDEIKYSASANAIYKNEANSLDIKLTKALKNAPRERAAQILANSTADAQIKDNPGMSKDDIKKLKQQALERARTSVGAKREQIEITDKEWEAIQAGAISKTKLKQILNFADMEIVREKAMPREKKTLSTAQINSLKAKIKTGRYTNQELATFYGVSTSYISQIVKGKEN